MANKNKVKAAKKPIIPVPTTIDVRVQIVNLNAAAAGFDQLAMPNMAILLRQAAGQMASLRTEVTRLQAFQESVISGE